MGAKSKETAVVSKGNERDVEISDEVNFTSAPSKNVKDSWNQITLSLASNGGFTINSGRNCILSVFIKEKINGKEVIAVKSFVVTKQELSDLEYESREFSAEIEEMIKARDTEEDKVVIPKDIIPKKKDDKKKNIRAFTEMLKKNIDSVRKKDSINNDDFVTAEGDLEDPDPDNVDNYIVDKSGIRNLDKIKPKPKPKP